MKKFNFFGVLTLIVVLGFSIIISCKKEEQRGEVKTTINSSNGIISGTVETAAVMFPKLTDVELIAAVKGLKPQYKEASILFELLADNARLSTSVLTAIASEGRLHNDFVEIFYILSAPVSVEAMNQLKVQRPLLNTQNIAKANSSLHGKLKFSILNYPAHEIVFGQNLTRQAVETANCSQCSSIIDGITAIISFGTDTPDNVEPAEILGACNPEKWTCGKMTRKDILPAPEGIKRFMIECVGESRKCVRKMSTAVDFE